MTDELTSMTPDDETEQTEKQKIATPAVDEVSTAAIPPVASSEATQTIATIVEEATLTEATLDEVNTIIMTPAASGETSQATLVAEPAEAVPTTPQPVPAQVYEHFGAVTEAVQPMSYPDPALAPATPPASDPATFYTQSAYAPQPGQAVAQAPAQKKRSPLLVMIAIALVAFLLGGGSVFAYNAIQSQPPSPNSTLQKYCDGVNTANAQEIYDTLSQQAKVHTSLDDIQKTFSGFSLLNSLGSDSGMKLGKCAISNLRVSGSLAVATVTVTLDMTFQGQTISAATPYLVSLVLENNQWKVDFSSLTQPAPSISGSLFPGGLPTVPPDFLTPTVGQ